MKFDKNIYAYELGYGHADGFHYPHDGKNHNPYEKNSKQFDQYEDGYNEWLDRNLHYSKCAD